MMRKFEEIGTQAIASQATPPVTHATENQNNNNTRETNLSASPTSSPISSKNTRARKKKLENKTNSQPVAILKPNNNHSNNIFVSVENANSTSIPNHASMNVASSLSKIPLSPIAHSFHPRSSFIHSLPKSQSFSSAYLPSTNEPTLMNVIEAIQAMHLAIQRLDAKVDSLAFKFDSYLAGQAKAMEIKENQEKEEM
jgi:hypothetical protein